jgi:hypothetical protein
VIKQHIFKVQTVKKQDYKATGRKDVETPIHLIKNCQALTMERREVFSAETLEDNFDWSPDQILEFIKKTGVWNRLIRQPNGLYL